MFWEFRVLSFVVCLRWHFSEGRFQGYKKQKVSENVAAQSQQEAIETESDTEVPAGTNADKKNRLKKLHREKKQEMVASKKRTGEISADHSKPWRTIDVVAHFFYRSSDNL